MSIIIAHSLFFVKTIDTFSDSIKQVLPAVLNSGQYLKDKYSKPIYGSELDTMSMVFIWEYFHTKL